MSEQNGGRGRPHSPAPKNGNGRLPFCHFIALAAILLVCGVVFVWAGAAFLPAASQKVVRQIVCDDYDTLTAPLEPGGEIVQTVRVEGKIYGVRVNVATFNRVVRGTLRLRVLDAAGREAAGCDTDMAALLDNTFHLFLFARPLEAGEGGRYTLVFTAEDGSAPIAFHKSAGRAADYVIPGDAWTQAMAGWPEYRLAEFALAENGAGQAGTLALQYIVRYAGGAGGFLPPVYVFFAVLLTVFLMALYTLVFVVKWPVHRLFLVCALVLGFVFSFLIPPRTSPDEYVHIATAYQYGNAVLGQGGAPPLTVRAGDEMMLHTYDFSATDVFAYQDIAEGVFTKAPAGEPVQIPAREAKAFPLMYAAPAAGVLLARFFGLGRVALLLFGRWANLIFYAVLVSRAIKRMPLARPALFCAGLLPSALQLAASFSYDTYAIALAFYVTAYALQLAFSKERATLRRLVGLGAAAALLAPAKAVYMPLLAVLFFIPASKLAAARPKRARGVFLAATLACALVLWAAGNGGEISRNLRGALGSAAPPAGVSQSAAANAAAPADGDVPGEAAGTGGAQTTAAAGTLPDEEGGPAAWAHAGTYFTPGYILRNVAKTAKMLMNSLWTQSALWLQGLLGGRLGEPIAITLEVNWLFTIGLLACLAAAAVPNKEDAALLPGKMRLGLGAAVAAVLAALLAVCTLWTPTDYAALFGFQGRYLLPVLPAALLALRGGALEWKTGAWRVVAVAAPCLAAAVCLQVFLQVVQR